MGFFCWSFPGPMGFKKTSLETRRGRRKEKKWKNLESVEKEGGGENEPLKTF